MRRPLVKPRKERTSDELVIPQLGILPIFVWADSDEFSDHKSDMALRVFRYAFSRSLAIRKQQKMAEDVEAIKAKAFELEEEVNQYITKL